MRYTSKAFILTIEAGSLDVSFACSTVTRGVKDAAPPRTISGDLYAETQLFCILYAKNPRNLWLNSDKELITYQLLADGFRGAYGQIPSDF